MLVAFDMFGTLADTASVARELASFCGDMAGRVARTWRDKQLEYMFRVTAMGQFPPFADLTRWSLAWALAESGITLAPVQLDAMAGAYRRLRPFDDARPALAALRERGHSIVVFSGCAPRGASASQTRCSTPGDRGRLRDLGPLRAGQPAARPLTGSMSMSLARLVGRARDSWACLDAGDPGRGAPGGQWRR